MPKAYIAVTCNYAPKGNRGCRPYTIAEVALTAAPTSAAEKAAYYARRVELFERYWAREQDRREAAKAANAAINIIMPDGSVKPGVAGVTTPMEVAASISKSLAKRVVVADVDGDAWDLQRPLQGDCALKLYSFDDVQGKDVSASSSWFTDGQRWCVAGPHGKQSVCHMEGVCTCTLTHWHNG